MATQPKSGSPSTEDDFAQQARQRQAGPVRTLWEFVRYNKIWWLTPIVLILLMVGLLIALGSTVAAPFIYTLF
jgi:hypothetical protein